MPLFLKSKREVRNVLIWNFTWGEKKKKRKGHQIISRIICSEYSVGNLCHLTEQVLSN